MRILITLTIAFALLVTVAPVMAQNAADEAAIREATKQIIETVNSGDLTVHSDLYTDPYETFGDSQDRAAHQQTHERLKDLRLKVLDDLGVVFVTLDVAIHKFRQEVTGGGWMMMEILCHHRSP